VVVERDFERRSAALADAVGFTGEIDADRSCRPADVEHVGQTFEAQRRLRHGVSSLRRALEQIFLAIEIKRGQTRGAGERMRRIGVAVEQSTTCSGPCMKASYMPLRTSTPPIGTLPEVTPLANVIMSGTTP